MSLRRSLAAALGAVAVLTLASAAQAGPWGLAPGEFYTELVGSVFSSDSYLDRNGDRPPLGGTFEERALAAHAEFGWKKHTTFIMEMPFVARTFASDIGGGTLSSAGLGDIGLGLRFAGHFSGLPMSVEAGWTAPLGTNRNLFPGTSGSGGADPTSWYDLATRQMASDSSAFFAQGLQSLSLRAHVGGAAGSKTFWAVGGGVRYRYLTVTGTKYKKDGADVESIHGSRWATFSDATAMVGYWVSPAFLLTGEARGEWTSAQGDGYDRLSGTPAKPKFATGPILNVTQTIVGPRFTYRVDERMDVFAGSWHTARGENVLHENYYYFGIAWKHTGLDRLAGALGGTKAPSKEPAAPAAAPTTTTPATPTTPKQ